MFEIGRMEGSKWAKTLAKRAELQRLKRANLYSEEWERYREMMVPDALGSSLAIVWAANGDRPCREEIQDFWEFLEEVPEDEDFLAGFCHGAVEAYEEMLEADREKRKSA